MGQAVGEMLVIVFGIGNLETNLLLSPLMCSLTRT